ncbi:uncharacterized protein LOC107199119 [Parus major]|uniref:uncharacterized protein LOC107199119 n=1 Tax=Parus major TaxID=9157 RepID=UPI00077133D0|nr:uncharacterized protein LOC107199119 [Parus major]
MGGDASPEQGLSLGIFAAVPGGFSCSSRGLSCSVSAGMGGDTDPEQGLFLGVFPAVPGSFSCCSRGWICSNAAGMGFAASPELRLSQGVSPAVLGGLLCSVSAGMGGDTDPEQGVSWGSLLLFQGLWLLCRCWDGICREELQVPPQIPAPHRSPVPGLCCHWGFFGMLGPSQGSCCADCGLSWHIQWPCPRSGAISSSQTPRSGHDVTFGPLQSWMGPWTGPGQIPLYLAQPSGQCSVPGDPEGPDSCSWGSSCIRQRWGRSRDRPGCGCVQTAAFVINHRTKPGKCCWPQLSSQQGLHRRVPRGCDVSHRAVMSWSLVHPGGPTGL